MSMVTAGVFLISRCSPLYELTTVAINVVAVFGCLTVKLGRPGKGRAWWAERERERVIEIFIPRRPLFLVLALPARL